MAINQAFLFGQVPFGRDPFFGKTRLRAGIRHPHTDQWFGGLMSGVPLCLGLGSRRSLSSRFAVYLLPSRARSTLTTSSLHLQEL
jgi:hypothetical protein